MKQPKKFLIAGLGAAILTAVIAVPSESSGQAAAAPANDAQALAALVTEITDQHTKIAANQQLMDEKIADIAENIRLAKIFVSRGGGSGVK